MKKWPTYTTKELGLRWTFFSFFYGKNWAIGLIKFEDEKPAQPESESE